MQEVPAALPRQLHAFVDEAGVRSRSPKSSDHFVMSAVVIAEQDLPQASLYLEGLRKDLGRQPGDTLHWQNFRKHEQRVHAAKTLGAQEWATISSVVVCKRHLPAGTELTEDQAYLFTLRFLLERLSWLARDSRSVLSVSLAHIVRMKLATLREYEANLRADQTQIEWSALNPKGARFEYPNALEFLQLADIAASATFSAFRVDPFGNTERRYLKELAPRLYRRGAGALTSYGLKMHPWSGSTKAAYPWVAAL
ncbi:hypothetical protein J3A78_003847 [Streptomyces sp. PvR006]|uniref:DUF3800 domain-containing protein n=1 Tax=Streptomyces sp. PvR006 TaxID=2817860 RepID=UPI001AE3599E|nr:DUF3800 domain-containing protein [Streptomyces sp. PvR006]MBP2583369.1 hypothetical protein [Streptomyces sp. PvR006]